ncbi:MAG: hypothetical protein ACK8QZ_11770, partial [Anaerolineales bacterium]
SPDSWSPFGEGGLNAYGYCGGDPRNRVDKNGHASVKLFADLYEIVKIPRPTFIYSKAPQTLLPETAKIIRPSNKIGLAKATNGRSADFSAGADINNQTLGSPQISTQGAAPLPAASQKPLARRPSLERVRTNTKYVLDSHRLSRESDVAYWERMIEKKVSRSIWKNASTNYTLSDLHDFHNASKRRLRELNKNYENLDTLTKEQLKAIRDKL